MGSSEGQGLGVERSDEEGAQLALQASYASGVCSGPAQAAGQDS